MLVLLTGGTGYLGSHTVAQLLRAGHQVRLLVRDDRRLDEALRPLDVDPATVRCVAGDITDAHSVARAVRGCDAVVHAAGSYSFDSRRYPQMRSANVHGTEVVLAAARAVGADPIVYVSTFAALLPAATDRIGVDSPAGRPREAYMGSKAAAEMIARRHQEEGAPVVITYPLATLGPVDPRLGDQVTRIRNTLRGLMPFWPSGGFPIGDVRDVARLHSAVLEPGRGPRRFIAPGRYVSTAEYLRTLREVTGRRLPALRLPAAAMLPVAALASVAQRVVPVHIPAEYGAVYACRVGRPVDNAATRALVGDAGRPVAVTVRDTVRWLYSAGLLSRAAAGRAAERSAPPGR